MEPSPFEARARFLVSRMQEDALPPDLVRLLEAELAKPSAMDPDSFGSVLISLHQISKLCGELEHRNAARELREMVRRHPAFEKTVAKLQLVQTRSAPSVELHSSEAARRKLGLTGDAPTGAPAEEAPNSGLSVRDLMKDFQIKG